MKKVLYVDLDAPIGHISFNRIWLSVLMRYPIDLTTCFSHEYYDKIGIQTTNISVPACICCGKGPLFWRIFSIIRLIWLRFFVNTKKYDIVLFSSFENTTLSFVLSLFSYGNVFCVCHNNIEQARNNSKHKFFLRFVAKRVSLIALNNTMRGYLESELSAKKTICIQHGFPSSIQSPKHHTHPCFDDMFRNKNIIFVPSMTSVSDQALLQIQKNSHLIEALRNNNIQVVISKKTPIITPHFFYSFPKRLTDDEYSSVFQHAKAILLLYPDTFFRLSAILHEAIINNKTVFLPNIDILDDYKKIIPETLFFDSIDQIAEIISKFQNYQELKYQIPDYMKKPDFNHIINTI